MIKKIGYKLMAEEHGPAALVRNAVRAEQAGFDFAAISDHFFPWIDEQGHSPFAWTVLGAAAQATSHIGLMTAVTCPIMRYHPAIVAQAAATTAMLSGDRLVLGLGSGERLNEHVVGEGWPGIGERHERLSEAYDIIRGLLDGSLTNYRGTYFTLDNAKLFDRPDRVPPIIGAAGGAEAARLTGRKADGLITTVPDAALVEAFKSAGGNGPLYAEVSICYAESEDKARKIAHRYHRWSLVGGPVMPELPDPESFAAASSHITPEQVGEEVSLGSSPEPHLKAIREYIDAGYDHLILTQIGPEQDAFCGFFERELRPALASYAKNP
ncbi:MAG: TIGR03557 family F420-dependent LLM class oxidoreductase [Alphaproteobacteria bacterium]